MNNNNHLTKPNNNGKITITVTEDEHDLLCEIREMCSAIAFGHIQLTIYIEKNLPMQVMIDRDRRTIKFKNRI